ncbi:MAG: hypothetical protein QOC63_5386, partial [Mycobacterium sp.]|nr:hypothetical protein [Mycobacterium sp.]
MVPVDLSLLEPAPVSFAGKLCLRQSCGHHLADHMSSLHSAVRALWLS